MSQRGNQDYGKRIAEAVLANVDDPANKVSARRTWLSSWIEPAPARDRARRWLSMWLKADLKNIPPNFVIKYLNEMAIDVRLRGSDDAVDRFIDKILPEIVSNDPPEGL